jgi:hypothetical protein
VNRGEDKLLGNVSCVRVRLGGTPRPREGSLSSVAGKASKKLNGVGDREIIVQGTGDELRARKAVPVFEVY